jgi:hypothetical protein
MTLEEWGNKHGLDLSSENLDDGWDSITQMLFWTAIGMAAGIACGLRGDWQTLIPLIAIGIAAQLVRTVYVWYRVFKNGGIKILVKST